MFDHHCTACEKRELIFPSQVTSLTNTDQGIVVGFTCWCGADQTMLTGAKAPSTAPAASPAAAKVTLAA